MKYVNQKAYPDWLYITRTGLDEAEREKGKTTTVYSSACDLCSAVMVADRLLPECDFDLRAALRLSYETNANHRLGTDYLRFAPAFAQLLNLDWAATSDPQEMLECLRTGGVAVALVHGDREGRVGVFSHSGHYVVVLSQERDGRLAILDPAYLPGRYDEEGRKGLVELKYGIVAHCALEVLAEDAAPRDPCYFLFWRK